MVPVVDQGSIRDNVWPTEDGKHWHYSPQDKRVNIQEQQNIMNFEYETPRSKEKDFKAYKEAFDYYDWNKSGTISIKVRTETFNHQIK